MKNRWKKAISDLQDEIPSEVFESLISLDAKEFVEDQSLVKIKFDNKSLLEKINESIKKRIENSLRRQTSKDFVLQISYANQSPAPKPSWLNSSYTFSQFIQSQSNQLACLACEAVVMQLGRSNPFFLHGEPGMGKTHLVHSMVHEILNKYPEKKIYYNTFSDFQDNLTNSLSNRTILEYKKSLKGYDVFIIENIEELSTTKRNIADEFFHIFNYYYDNSKQLIFTSNISANYLNLKGSLQSRILSGLQVEILPPDPNLVKEIIFRRVQDYNLKIPQSLTEKLLNFQPSSIRELESILNRLYFLKEKGIRVQNVAEIQRNFIEIFSEEDPVFTIDSIVQLVCQKFQITKEQILSNSRKAEFTLPRHIAMYLSVKYSTLNKSAIARYFKKSDHTTVINAEKNISRRIQKEKGFKQTLEQIVNQLRIRCG